MSDFFQHTFLKADSLTRFLVLLQFVGVSSLQLSSLTYFLLLVFIFYAK